MSKAGTRRKSRELALQMLFQLDMGKQSADDVRKTFWTAQKDIDDKVRGFADELFGVAVALSVCQSVWLHVARMSMAPNEELVMYIIPPCGLTSIAFGV